MSDLTTTHSAATPVETPHAIVGEHSHSDTVVLPVIGSVTVPGGIYTVVFIGLGILTVLEVLIAELFKGDFSNILKIILLMGIGFIKALLVVMFYMHLRSDNPLFRVVLVLPLVIVILCLLYLMAIPTGGGLGYLPG